MRSRAFIEKTVANLRRKHGATTLPVDVRALAEKEGVRVALEDLEDQVSGALLARDGQAVMAVNSNHPPRRQRFTMAHELGHRLLHWESGEATAFVDGSLSFRRDERSKDGSLDVEREANAFAAELLMPRLEIEKWASQSAFDPHDEIALKKMCGLFGVSEAALLVRLSSLGLLEI